MCPFCGRDAPIVYRGLVPCCTACGRLRLPLSSPSVNLTGKPSKVGGAVARLAGWLVLLVGFAVALGLGLLVYALATMTAALAFALPVALVALAAGGALVQSGRLLARSGATLERTTHDQALLELAAHRGPVTAGEAARALGISPLEADAILTDLAKREPERVVLDVSDEGVIRFRAVEAREVPADVHLRVAPGAPHPAPVRVENSGDVEPEGEGSVLADETAERAARLR